MKIKVHCSTLPLAERPLLIVEAASTLEAIRMVMADPKLLERAYGDRRRRPDSCLMLSAQPVESQIPTHEEMQAKERDYQQQRIAA